MRAASCAEGASLRRKTRSLGPLCFLFCNFFFVAALFWLTRRFCLLSFPLARIQLLLYFFFFSSRLLELHGRQISSPSSPHSFSCDTVVYPRSCSAIYATNYVQRSVTLKTAATQRVLALSVSHLLSRFFVCLFFFFLVLIQRGVPPCVLLGRFALEAEALFATSGFCVSRLLCLDSARYASSYSLAAAGAANGSLQGRARVYFRF